MSKRPKWITEPELDPDGSKDDYSHVTWGQYLSARQTQRLEDGLLSTPDDLRARLQLIGYYREKELDPKIWCHVFWMIEYRPRDWFCYYLPSPRSTSHKKAKLIEKLWRAQIKKQPRDWNILCSAASHLSKINERLSISLLKRALKLKPRKGLPARRLAQHYRVKAINGSQTFRSLNANIAFQYAEQALQHQDVWGEKIGILIEFTWVAIRERRLELARKWAKKLTNAARYLPLYKQYGYLYFAAINLAAGKNHLCCRNLNKLLMSFDSDTTHILDQPTLLAILSELVRRGEQDTVIHFVQAVEPLSRGHQGKTNWRNCLQEVKSGQIPSFPHVRDDPRAMNFTL